MNEQADFRNGKYQGGMNAQGQRHGLGIFIDDDLTFYISHWRENRINGLSLIYISHGKYIYGEWKDSEPHGLTVFRSGDTVLVGNCTRGRPTGKCLVIFERFNFACVLQEEKQEWSIVTSGQLVNYQTLLQYIEQMGTPVPDHYFSLTKFACHFSKHSSHVKTLPCPGGCCYFGYGNGLALVFNSANGLVSVGAHLNEQLGEFGGKFEGTRWAEEGNFERGGDRVRYSGERPTNKIYNIFQKLHKRSLDFHNEYFDSKVKYFTYIEQLLRNQLHLIANECRKDKQLRYADLSESLDFQEYTEQESLKINSIRDNLYEPRVSTTNKDQENREKSPKYFRKPEKTNRQLSESQFSHATKQKQELKTPKSSLKSKEPSYQASNFSMLKKTPIKETSEFMPESHKKHYPYIQVDIQKSQKQDHFMRESVENPSTPSKLRDKMKSNNLRYINTSTLQNQQEDIKERNPIVIKTNNIYKEIKNKKEEVLCASKETVVSSQDGENYRVPNFKCLANQIQKSKKIQSNTPVPKHPNQRGIIAPQPQPQPQPHSKYQKGQDRQEQRQPSPSQLPRRSPDVSALSKPSYEDIEQRRKRILKSYRDLNQPQPKEELKPDENRLESPCNNIVFSLGKEQHSSFGYMPITITDKPNRANVKNEKPEPIFNRSLRQEVLNERQSNLDRSVPSKEDHKGQKMLKYSNYPEQRMADENDNRVKSAVSTLQSSSKKGSTPARARKNYQYLYE